MTESATSVMGKRGGRPAALGRGLARGRATDVDEDPGLARMERGSEALIACVRVGVFAVVAGSFWWAGALDQDHMVLVSLAGFGIVTAVSAVAALAGYFRPWLPWAYATLDVGLLIHCLAVFTLVIGMPPEAMLSVPGAWMIFLYLAMAALRYRPGLVLYAGSLFVAGWAIVRVAAIYPAATIGVAHVGVHADMTLAAEMARFAIVV